MPAVRYRGVSAGYVARCQGAGRHPGRPVTLRVPYSGFSHTVCPHVRTGSRRVPASSQGHRPRCSIFPYFSTCLNVSANIREETMRGKRDRYTGRNSHG